MIRASNKRAYSKTCVCKLFSSAWAISQAEDSSRVSPFPNFQGFTALIGPWSKSRTFAKPAFSSMILYSVKSYAPPVAVAA